MKKTTTLKTFNKVIINSAVSIANKLKAKSVFLYSDSSENFEIIKDLAKNIDIVLVTRVPETFATAEGIFKHVLKVTNVNLTRTGQIKIAVMKGLSAGLIDKGDRIVCLAGVPKLGSLDNIVVLDIGKEFELLTSETVSDIVDKLKHEVFETVLNLAVELANQGREGKQVGTIFVVGDSDKVMQLSRQLIINPFKGYDESEKNILDSTLWETVKEFSVIDGAFVIGENGVVLSAGRYLSASLETKSDLPTKGLGSRHMAAAGITSVTEAIAIVISESTGAVKIYKQGKIFMDIERSV